MTKYCMGGSWMIATMWCLCILTNCFECGCSDILLNSYKFNCFPVPFLKNKTVIYWQLSHFNLWFFWHFLHWYVCAFKTFMERCKSIGKWIFFFFYILFGTSSLFWLHIILMSYSTFHIGSTILLIHVNKNKKKYCK